MKHYKNTRTSCKYVFEDKKVNVLNVTWRVCNEGYLKYGDRSFQLERHKSRGVARQLSL